MEKESILNKSKIINLICSVAIEGDGKYALIKEAKKEVKNLWNFPSGKVMFGETPIETATREALEETGYKCEVTDLMSIYYFYWDDMPGLTIRFNFWAKLISNKKEKLAKDVQESQWLGLGEIVKLAEEGQLRHKTTHQMLKDIAEDKRCPLDILKFI